MMIRNVESHRDESRTPVAGARAATAAGAAADAEVVTGGDAVPQPEPAASAEHTAAAEIVTLGEALLRLATPAGQRLAAAPALEVHVAGAEANVAAALAQLGVSTRWVSRLPHSVLGRRVERELAQLGVLVDAIEWAPAGRLGLFFSDTGVPPRPTAVTYDRQGSTFTDMTAAPAHAFEGARVVHVSGVTAALGVDRLLHDVLTRARSAHLELSVDVNYRALLWGPAEARVGLEPLLRQATTVICGERDAREVFELDGRPHNLLEQLRECWAPASRQLVLTRGAAGCVALDEHGTHYEQPAVEATIVDRFGMGDAFAAGLLWGLLRDDDLSVALRAAATLAALKATLAGDLLRVDAAELLAALAPETRAIVR